MITRQQLAELFKALGDQKVLSVYLTSDATDPADREQWRRRFERHAAEARRRLDGEGSPERKGFDSALEHVESALSGYNGFLPDRGWVGFATPERLHHAEPLHASAPELVRWAQGPRLGPYVRNLKLTRPVAAALVDQHEARIYLSRAGELETLATFSAQHVMHDVEAGVSKRSETHSGVRGETKHDAAARSLAVETERMLGKAAAQLTNGESEWPIVLGGTREAVAALRSRLSERSREQAVEVQSLHMGVSEAELREALEEAASELTKRRQARLVDEVVDAARARGRAVLGPEATSIALQLGAVHTLLLSRGYLAAHLEEAEGLVDRAISQGADVEELGGEPAVRLDEQADGTAARLRFPVPVSL